MISESVTPILASIGSFLLIVAGGGKWLMVYLDAKDKASALREFEARNELSKRLHEEISQLRADISKLQTKYERESGLYRRRITDLEGAINRQPGMPLPNTLGWPPEWNA